MVKEKDIDQLIQMLDQFAIQGSSHMNVQVNQDGELNTEEISITQGMDCALGDTACKIPNLPMEDDDEY